MAAPYELNDDSVVVIIGSGAGGGTLGNELAQGPQLSWESACFASMRSSVRSRLAPPFKRRL